MTLEQLSRGIWETYSVSKADVISDKIKPSDLASMLKTVIENYNNGQVFFPDALYDAESKRNRRAKSYKPSLYLAAHAEANGLVLFKFRHFLPSTGSDSVYSPRTIGKAKTFDARLLGDVPRTMKLERAGGRNGDLHVQGLLALPEGNYPANNYERLDYRDIGEGVRQWTAYLSKPADGRLERDRYNLVNPFEVVLLGLADWYRQSLKNRRNGLKRNPRTTWEVNIPRG